MAFRNKVIWLMSLSALMWVGCAGPRNGLNRLSNEEQQALLDECGQILEQRAREKTQVVGRAQMPDTLPSVRLGQPGISTIGGDTPPPMIETRPANPADFPGGLKLPDVTPVQNPAKNNVIPVAASADSTGTTSSLPKEDVRIGTPQIKIVAMVGESAIYHNEVREMVFQRLGEFVRLTGSERAKKEKEIYREELRRIIERELILDDMKAFLSSRKQAHLLTKLQEAGTKEADAQLEGFKRDRGLTSDDQLREMMASQGMSMEGIRRQLERTVVMQIYMKEKLHLNDYMETVSLADIRDYYYKHPDEFQSEDKVKWEHYTVLSRSFEIPTQANLYAQHFANNAQKGTSKEELLKQFTAVNEGIGNGEEPGKIFPSELEPTVLSMKPNEWRIVPSDVGVHIIHVSERAYKGVRPYDKKVQTEIRGKLKQQVYEREAKRHVDTLWIKVQPKIYLED